ncbi:MAG TPA: glycosyl hydrolase family 8 [Polyangiaceae bacterium]|nr:glycosyl hydrolase family 8 [Polyangiaceae bacterium]
MRTAIVAVPLAIIACGTSDNGNNGFVGGTGNSGTTGNSGSSGNGGSGTGNSGNTGSSGGGTGSTGSSGSGTGSSGSGTGSSGSGTGSSGTMSGTTGTTSGSSGTGTGSTGSSSGSSGTTGTSGTVSTGPNDAGASACGTPAANVLADFEQDEGILIPEGTRNGYFYVYSDGSETITPAAVKNGPIAVGAAPSDDKTLAGETCNKYALVTTSTNGSGAAGNYAGVGAAFIPNSSGVNGVYSLAGYDGIQFDIKGGSGQPPMYFEVQTQETQPTTAGGTVDPNDTAAKSISNNNNRGYYLAASGSTPSSSTSVTGTAIPTAMSTVYVPFAYLVPRLFPAPSTCGTETCQAPAFNPAHALAFNFNAVSDVSTNNTVLDNLKNAWNLTIDNMVLYTGDNGLNPTNPTMASPTFNDGSTGFASCKAAIPTFLANKSAAGKYLQAAYQNWKTRFVSGTAGSARKVIRPENGNDTVSEGIGYGMILAVYFNDQPLFNDLWSYEQQNVAVSSLMTWCIPAGSNSCNASGGGTATDADEDMAFALIEAGKKWGGTYTSTATSLITAIWANDIDATSNLPKGGSHYATTSGNVTNPSYFAPAFYRIFGSSSFDSSHPWSTVATNSINAISALAGSNGLVPAWCSNNCTAAASNGATTDTEYQYDAHRVPWRVGTDYCWNGTSAAQSYLSKIAGFFNGKFSSSGGMGGGIDSIYDIYMLNGGADTGNGAVPNSMSAVGTAAVGAMSGGATYSAFVDAAWQFLLDGGNRAALDVNTSDATKTSYSYFNATVGLMTALTLSGNFYPM